MANGDRAADIGWHLPVALALRFIPWGVLTKNTGCFDSDNCDAGLGIWPRGVDKLRELRAKEIKTVTDESCLLVSAVEPLMNVLGYLAEVVKLKEPVVRRVADYRSGDAAGFVLHQHELDGLPGVTLDSLDDDGPVWLRVERLQKIEPPAIDLDLGVWIEISADPDRLPSIRESVIVTVDGAEKDRLVEAKQARAADLEPAITPERRHCDIFNVRLRLADDPGIAARLDAYVAGPWTTWAQTEKPRRRSMEIRARLSNVLPVGDPTDRSDELVWGIGVSRWRRDGNEIALPVLERSVAIEAGENGEIRIRPRMAGAIADLRGFQTAAATGAAAAAESSRLILEAIERDGEVSPFVRDSFEPVLRIVSSQLDPEGVYLGSDHEGFKPDDSSPEAPEHLAVSDSWVIFARPRTKSLVLRDIERFRDEIDRIAKVDGEIPMLARVLAFGTSDDAATGMRQALSGVIGRPIDIEPVAEQANAEVGDLFFPLPSNVDQIDVVQRLQISDGLIMRATPGPAKTNAIVNVVCHHLALGQRVLVVCRGKATLQQLHDKFPAAIRHLAIGLTGDDRRDLAQVEAAVRRLQSIVDTIKPRDHVELINQLESDVIATRRLVDELTEEASNIARNTPGFAEMPFDLARKLVVEADLHAWFEDRPPLLLTDTSVSLAAVDAARAARIRLGADLSHIDDDLPEAALLPDAAAVARMHENLALEVEPTPSATEPKERRLARRAVKLLELQGAARFADDLEALAAAHLTVVEEPWLAPSSPLRSHDDGTRAESAALVEFARDATSLLSRRAAFLLRPVDVPAAALTDQAVLDVIGRLSAGEKVFTTFAAREKRQKPVLAAITIAGMAADGRDDWQHIRDYLMWRRDIQALNARWKALAVELGVPTPTSDYPQMIHGFEKVVKSINVAIVTAAVAERNVTSVAGAKLLIPRSDIDALLADVGELQKLGSAVRAAVTECEASRLELTKLQEMFAGEGGLPAAVRDEVLARIGQGDADQISESWTRLRQQIVLLHDRREDFDRVDAVCKAFADAGAPIFARRVRTEVVQPASGDQVFAADWAGAWNWASLTRQLKEIGQEQHLRQFSDRREQLEKTLRGQFEAVVTARADFAAARSLSGTFRRALAIFMIAVRKIASAADGLAAHHHRRMAREALDGCCEGIPCWIVPSWRVAERLPAKLGAFDLVVIDEASGADVCELATLLRGRKVLVIGDDREVEPPPLQSNSLQIESVGDSFLRALPRTIRPFVLPGSSLYDLAKVMFPGHHIHLREDLHSYRDLIGAVSHSGEPRTKVTAGSVEDALRAPAIDTVSGHDEPWEAPRTSVRSAAEVMADEISKVVARLPGNNRRERADAVQAPADRKPVQWDEVPIVSAPIDDPQIAKGDWPVPERLPETDVRFAALPPLRVENPSRGGAEEHPQKTRFHEAAPSWLVRARLVDDTPRPGTAAAEETPAESKTRAGGLEPTVVAQPRRAKARLSKGRGLAIAAVFLLMLAPAVAYSLSGLGLNPRLAATLASISDLIPRKFSLPTLVKGPDLLAQSDEPDVAQKDAVQKDPVQNDPTSVQPKNVSTTRIDPPAASESSSTAPPAAAVAQRAVLYEEDPTDSKGKRYAGGVIWRTENVSPASGMPPELVVKADLNMADAKTAVSMTFRRNTDRTMPASHVVEIKFDRPRDTPAGEISKLHGLLMKQDGKIHGAPLEGEAAKVTPGYFMVALASGATQLQRNLKLLKDYPGFEVVVDYSNGSKAILLIDKGASGEQAFKDAFAAWGQ